MMERRIEQRLMCADLVDIRWKDKTGRMRRAIANLEDISLSGACLQIDQMIPSQTAVVITLPKGKLSGTVKHCAYRDIGYFVGIEFEPGSKWSQQNYRPLHLLDPRSLVRRVTNRLARRDSALVQ